MEPVKNPLGLVRAFARLVDAVPGSRAALRLVFVGTGPLKGEVETAIAAAGLQDIVWLAGGRNDVPDLVRHFDVFVLPSLNEGISNTLLEAMASGLPVIAGRVGGNPEIVREGETGALYSVDDDHALVEVLRRYVTEAELRRRQGARAREVAEDRHSLTSMVNAYLHVYDSVVATNR
jgi:glycosyltransferase involved in cell wall biosynthesis